MPPGKNQREASGPNRQRFAPSTPQNAASVSGAADVINLVSDDEGSAPQQYRQAPGARISRPATSGAPPKRQTGDSTPVPFTPTPHAPQRKRPRTSVDPAEGDVASSRRNLFSGLPELNEQQLEAAHSNIRTPSLIVAGASTALAARGSALFASSSARKAVDH